MIAGASTEDTAGGWARDDAAPAQDDDAGASVYPGGRPRAWGPVPGSGGGYGRLRLPGGDRDGAGERKAGACADRAGAARRRAGPPGAAAGPRRVPRDGAGGLRRGPAGLLGHATSIMATDNFGARGTPGWGVEGGR